MKRMSETTDLFKKFLLSKAENNKCKTTMNGSEAIKPFPPRALIPPEPTQPPYLEQELLSDIGPQWTTHPMSFNKSTSNLKAQLTIFYSGLIYVFDDVPLDKAQAIMLLAGESSSPNLIKAQTSAKLGTAALPSSNFASIHIPIARKHSLQQFLEKRRNRIISKSPYPSPISAKEKYCKPTLDGCPMDSQTSSSMPSRLG
ncbi:PREDICTED: protein TIFY 3-like [Nelumbo nucifera]|uniref:Protein TIFY n=2 Tax=Nelumbo nucifera TaxID=4432 RepID=A0A1U8A4N0_NELNU|nr:PREDICTED: protein TIFY 3-like [Nelumbo nucifera]DAD39345.1 TPA_asm: hypothetical protein HUJ06_013668 [Nelumbo nucifera]